MLMGSDSNTTNLSTVMFRQLGLLNIQAQCMWSTTFSSTIFQKPYYITEICLRYAQMYLRFPQNFPEICLRYGRDKHEILGGSKIPKNSCMNQHQSLSHSSTIYKITCKISSLKLHGKGPLKPRTLYKGNFKKYKEKI